MVRSPSTPTSMAQSVSKLWTQLRNIDIESIKRPVVSPEKSSDENGGIQQVSLESVMRVMFSSCTTGGVSSVDEASVPVASGAQSGSASAADTAGKTTARSCYNYPPGPREEAVYEQLFLDSKLRAEEAVCHLREQLEQKKEEWAAHKFMSSQEKKKSSNAIPKPFPVSNPATRREISIPNKVVQEQGGPSDSTTNPTDGATSPQHTLSMSFDDGISAISAATLEEMARMYEVDETLINRVHSDITQDPAELVMENWKREPLADGVSSPRRNNNGLSKMSPLNLTRTGRSTGTQRSKGTRSMGTRSMGTKSTMSTQTTEFANAWRLDEQKYWQDVVREQEEEEDIVGQERDSEDSSSPMTMKPRGLLRPDLKSKRDGTITTAGSSLYSSHQGTPVYQKTPGAFVADEMMNILVLPPGTETGEI